MNTVQTFYLLISRRISWDHLSEKWTLLWVTQGPFIAKTTLLFYIISKCFKTFWCSQTNFLKLSAWYFNQFCTKIFNFEWQFKKCFIIDLWRNDCSTLHKINQKYTVGTKVDCISRWTLDWWTLTFDVPQFLGMEHSIHHSFPVLGRID